jgi:tRNA(fMet)-specific endonuclease VapC
MAVFLLDTNIVVRAIKDREPSLNANIIAALAGGHELSLSVITLLELRVGVLRQVNRSVAEQKLALFLRLVPHAFDVERDDAMLAAEIRAELMSRGEMIGLFDLLIAAQAQRRGLEIVTNNLREFQRVRNLRCIDWTQG